jgi:integrase
MALAEGHAEADNVLNIRALNLRHTMGDTLAEAGASPNEIGAVLGHASAKSSLHYTQGADRKKLSRKGMARIISGTKPDHPSNGPVSVEDPRQTHQDKKV